MENKEGRCCNITLITGSEKASNLRARFENMALEEESKRKQQLEEERKRRFEGDSALIQKEKIKVAEQQEEEAARLRKKNEEEERQRDLKRQEQIRCACFLLYLLICIFLVVTYMKRTTHGLSCLFDNSYPACTFCVCNFWIQLVPYFCAECLISMSSVTYYFQIFFHFLL